VEVVSGRVQGLRLVGVRVVGWWGKDVLVLTVDSEDNCAAPATVRNGILGGLSSGRVFVCYMWTASESIVRWPPKFSRGGFMAKQIRSFNCGNGKKEGSGSSHDGTNGRTMRER